MESLAISTLRHDLVWGYIAGRHLSENVSPIVYVKVELEIVLCRRYSFSRWRWLHGHRIANHVEKLIAPPFRLKFREASKRQRQLGQRLRPLDGSRPQPRHRIRTAHTAILRSELTVSGSTRFSHHEHSSSLLHNVLSNEITLLFSQTM